MKYTGVNSIGSLNAFALTVRRSRVHHDAWLWSFLHRNRNVHINRVEKNHRETHFVFTAD